MNIHFSKYQGTGNDFIMINNMNGIYNTLSIEQIQQICDRKKGVGADGLIKLSKREGYDFEVEYFNADGSQSFCGNGARCSTLFARHLGLIRDKANFLAIDGLHQAVLDEDIVRLEMLDVDQITSIGRDFFVDTGSPHYIQFKPENALDIVEFGRQIRFSDKFEKEGVNVNYLKEVMKGRVFLETYERGVENETLSCGTGVTAGALVYMQQNGMTEGQILVETKGGNLAVEAERKGAGYSNIWLSGPAEFVFKGEVDV